MLDWASWTARIVLLTVAVSGAWPLVAMAQGTETNPYTSRIDLRMGRRVFQAQCASCHGLNARGGNEGVGPDLTTGRFQRAESDVQLYRVIRDGVRGTAMIGTGADAPEQELWQMVTYLRSLNEVADAPSGSPTAGQRLFTGTTGCADCHMVNGDGGRRGPDLSYVGDDRDPDELRTALTDPDAEIHPRWWTMRATNGAQTHEGLRMGEDTFSFRIMDENEQLRSFSKYGDWAWERLERSTMPAYGDELSTQQLDDLVAYLFSLRSDP